MQMRIVVVIVVVYAFIAALTGFATADTMEEELAYYEHALAGYQPQDNELRVKIINYTLNRIEEASRSNSRYDYSKDSRTGDASSSYDIELRKDLAQIAEIGEEKQPSSIWEYAMEVSEITYREPGVMKENGIMYGMGISYAYHNNWYATDMETSDNWMLKLETRYAYGQVDYQNSGTIDNIDDNIWELRGLIGCDYSISQTFFLTPYTGIGYRYLKDDSGGRQSSTGAWGYKREANYFYSPVGLEILNGLNDGWSVGLAVEYDHFWQGRQKSYLSSVDPGFNDLANRQKKGYGLRGAFKIQKKNEKIDFAIEPFIRYWNIKKSKNADLTFYGTVIGYGYEPANNSTEFGAKFSMSFL